MRVSRSYEETHKVIENEMHKLCIICEKWFPMTEEHFYKNKSSKRDGLNPYCKKCTIEKSKKNMNLDKQRERVKYFYRTRQRTRDLRKAVMDKRRAEGKCKEWQRKNPDKLRGYRIEREKRKKHEISKEEWENCKNYFNYRCAYCELPIEEHWVQYNEKIFIGDFHRDHVVDDGDNDLSNCIPSCKKCNCSKYTYAFEEWYNENNPNFTQERLEKINKWLEEDYKLFINKNNYIKE